LQKNKTKSKHTKNEKFSLLKKFQILKLPAIVQ
jgi:hypothetical protein